MTTCCANSNWNVCAFYLEWIERNCTHCRFNPDSDSGATAMPACTFSVHGIRHIHNNFDIDPIYLNIIFGRTVDPAEITPKGLPHTCRNRLDSRGRKRLL